MNRRNFFRLSAAGALGLPQFRERLIAAPHPATGSRRRVVDHAPDLVTRAMASQIPLPTIEPIFTGIFTPGGSQMQMISASGFTSFQ